LLHIILYHIFHFLSILFNLFFYFLIKHCEIEAEMIYSCDKAMQNTTADTQATA
jgi:hypothetical protein